MVSNMKSNFKIYQLLKVFRKNLVFLAIIVSIFLLPLPLLFIYSDSNIPNVRYLCDDDYYGMRVIQINDMNITLAKNNIFDNFTFCDINGTKHVYYNNFWLFEYRRIEGNESRFTIVFSVNYTGHHFEQLIVWFKADNLTNSQTPFYNSLNRNWRAINWTIITTEDIYSQYNPANALYKAAHFVTQNYYGFSRVNLICLIPNYLLNGNFKEFSFIWMIWLWKQYNATHSLGYSIILSPDAQIISFNYTINQYIFG